jgi:hypothetical protein
MLLGTIFPQLFGPDSYMTLMFGEWSDKVTGIVAVVVVGALGLGLWAGNPVAYVIVYLSVLGTIVRGLNVTVSSVAMGAPASYLIVSVSLNIIESYFVWALARKKAMSFYFYSERIADIDAQKKSPLDTLKRVIVYCSPLFVVIAWQWGCALFSVFGWMSIEEAVENNAGWMLSPWRLYGVMCGLFFVGSLLVVWGLMRLYNSRARPWMIRLHGVVKMLLGCVLVVFVSVFVISVMYIVIPRNENTNEEPINFESLVSDLNAVTSVVKSGATDVKGHFSLGGIIYGEHSVAVINGKSVAVGEYVAGYTVTRIEENNVVLTSSTGEELVLSQ